MYTVFTVHVSPGTQEVIFLGFYRSCYELLTGLFLFFLSDWQEVAHADLAKTKNKKQHDFFLVRIFIVLSAIFL